MKSSVKFSIGTFIILLSLILIFSFVQPIKAFPSLEKISLSDRAIRIQTTSKSPIIDIQLIENTDQCLVNCYAIVKFHPHITITLPDSPNSEFRFDFIKEKANMLGLRDYHFELLQNVSYNLTIPIYENTSYHCQNNETKENETCWRMEQTGSREEKIYKQEYRLFSFFGKTLEADKDYYIKLVGKKHSQLGSNNIDWIPTVKGFALNEWNWWNSSWNKRRPIDINVSDGATLTDFQVPTNVSYNNTMQSNFNDLRFTKNCSTETDELDYWLEEKIDSDWAYVWVEVPEINSTICMYYDNSEAESTSNGTNTFTHFWDWDSASSWTTGGTGTAEIDPTGQLHMNITSGNYKQIEKTLSGGLPDNFTNRFRLIVDAAQSGSLDWSERGYVNYKLNGIDAFLFFIGNDNIAYDNEDDTIVNYAHSTSEGVWHTWMVKQDSAGTGSMKIYKDDSYITEFTNVESITSSDGRMIHYLASSNTNLEIHIDWEFISKYHSPEPSYKILAEESDTIPPTWAPGSNQTNASDSTKTGETVWFNITWEDITNPYKYIFSFYNGTTWYNTTGSYTSGIPIQEIRTITATRGQTVQWRWYANDTFGNLNSTPIWSFTVANSPPTQTNPLLSTPSGKNFSYENLTCYNKSTFDADNDNVTNIYNWYKNSQPLAVLNMLFEINVNSNASGAVKDYSGYNNDGSLSDGNVTSPDSYTLPIWVSGKIGGAYKFDGYDDCLRIPSLSGDELNPLNSITVSAWVNVNTSKSNAFIITKGWGDSYELKLDSNNKVLFRVIHNLTDSKTVTSINSLISGEWYHVTGIYDGNSIKVYINGNFDNLESYSKTLMQNSQYIGIGCIPHMINSYFGNGFNGIIDEVKVYPYALTPEQIKQKYEETKDGLTSSSKIVSQETQAGDKYICQVIANDGYNDSDILNSSELEILVSITFNVTDSFNSSIELNNVIISCDYPDFDQEGDTTNPYGPYGFTSGSYVCTFEEDFHFDKTITFNADGDKNISVNMSEEKSLTVEEHTWLEAIHNCVVLDDCNLYNLLLQINQTMGNIWEYTKPTDETVITYENITNKIVNDTSNLTIDYTVNIPIKAGHTIGTYLPLRIGFWFLDEDNTTCYNQGDKPTGVEEPYCQPLITETMGPMNGSVSFTVELHPELPEGNYSIKRIIDIDPDNTWINYGQERIGKFTVTESTNTHGIVLQKTKETKSSEDEEKGSSDTYEYGAVPSDEEEYSEPLLSGWQIIAMTTIISIVLIVFIISESVIRLKKKSFLAL